MAFQKGRKKTGGRKAGEPNKRTKYRAEVLDKLLTEYEESGLMASDWMELEPRDRMAMAERFTHYLLPKKSSVDASVTEKEDTSVIEWMKELAGM